MVAQLDLGEIATMSDEQLALEVIALIDQGLTEDKNGIGSNSFLVEDFGIDSLGSYELMLDLEDRFGIKIDATNALQLKTIGDIVALVRLAIDDK